MAHTHLGSNDKGKPSKRGGTSKAAASSSKGHGVSRKASVGSKEGQARVQQVLDRFARALTAGDAEAAADVWQTPAFVLGAGMARAVSTRKEVVEFFSGAKEQYTSRGIDDTRAEIQRLDWVSDSLVVVDVRWPYLTADGEEIGEETSTYTFLADDDGQLKIRSVLMRGAAE